MTVPTAMGDYQTVERMAQKLRAIPVPADLTGKSVLDVGCDHGWWCKLASDRGAARVLGIDRGRGVRVRGKLQHVDLAARNNAEGWANCTFQDVNLAEQWPDLGAFDLVFCFSLYHHLYGETGSHDRIWQWLRARTAGELLWEGPVDTRDPIARDRAKGKPYTRTEILAAASRHFDVELVGPAIHRPHREVWRCVPKGANDNRDSPERVRPSEPSVPEERPVSRPATRAAVRLVAVPGNAQLARDRARRLRQIAGRAGPANRARDADRPLALVGGPDRVGDAAPQKPAVFRRPGRKVANVIPRDRVPAEPPITWVSGRVSRASDPSKAMVLGGADCVWSDIRRLEAMIGGEWDGLVIAVNDIGCHWPRRLDHWCSLHAANLPKWKKVRASAGFDMDLVTWSGTNGKQADRTVRPWGGGSSGLLAVSVATALGCTRIVLCGVPMEKAAHFKESKVHQAGRLWAAADSHWRAWVKGSVMSQLKESTRSMSGRTGKTLGEPTLDWLGLELPMAVGAE